MKETVEIRIYKKYASLLLSPGEGKNMGVFVSFEMPTDDPRFEKVRSLNEEVKNENNDFLFLYSEIKRTYSNKELSSSKLLHMKLTTTFEPSGEECGTLFDETSACKICGANRKQLGSLVLKRGTIPKKDIARTIAGETVVSEKFVNAFNQRGLTGAKFTPVKFTKGDSNYFQLFAENEIDIADNTVAGINPFDLSSSNGSEIYKCPNGHTIGLNLISEPYVHWSHHFSTSDFLASKQKIGVNRGLLKPEALLFCSQGFREMIVEERLEGVKFELSNILTSNSQEFSD